MLKGNKGVCIGAMPDEIRRTKWNTQENCQIALNSHLSLGVVPKDSVVYKCNVCGFWHFGDYFKRGEL